MMQAKGRYFSIVLYVQENLDPDSDRLVVMDGRMIYYLRDFDTVVMYPATLRDLEGYDYLLHSASFVGVYNDRLGLRDSEFYRYVWNPLIFESVYVNEGVHVMRILRTDIPKPEEYEAYRATHPPEEP